MCNGVRDILEENTWKDITIIHDSLKITLF